MCPKLRVILQTVVAVVCLSACLTGCANSVAPPPPSFVTSSQSVEKSYRLGIGDKLKISVFGEADLSGQVEVNAFGQVSLPLIGEVGAKGLSLRAFRERVRARLADGYLNNPRVTVEVLNYRAFFVHGEVKSGGKFPFKIGTQMSDAIATAGGFTYRADTSYVIVKRSKHPEFRIDLPSDIAVLPGDNIRVPERFF